MKKLLSLVLALMMLTLPVLAEEAYAPSFVEQAVANGRRAETTVTLTDLNALLAMMLFGADQESIAMIQELLESVALTGYVQGDEAGFALKMKGMDVANAALGLAEDDVLLGSNLLGKAPVALNVENLKPVAERILTYYADALQMTEADMAVLLTLLEPEVLKSMFEGYAAPAVPEETLEMDFSAFDALIAEWEQLIVVEPVTVQPEDCDPADTKAILTIPAEEANRIFPAMAAFVEANPMLLLNVNASLAEEGVSWAEIKPYLAEIKAFAEPMVCEAYMAGEKLVKFGWTTAIAGADGENQPIALSYGKLDGTISLIYVQTDALMVSLVYAEKMEAAATQQTLELSLSVFTEEAPVTFGLAAECRTATDGLDATDLTTVTLMVMGMPFITLNVDTKTLAPTAVMTVADAVDLSKLTEEDFQAWCMTMETNAAMAIFMGMMLLPQSLQEMLMAE